MYDSVGDVIQEEEVKFIKIKKINLYLINNIMTFRLMFKIYRNILSASIDTKKIISPFNEKTEHNIFYFTNQYSETIEQIVNFAEKNNIGVILVKQAVYFDPVIQKQIEKKSIDKLILQLQNLRSKPLKGLDYAQSFWIVTISILNKQLDKFKDNSNVILVDPVQKLISTKAHFEDYSHLTPKGNKVIAENIYEELKTKLD